MLEDGVYRSRYGLQSSGIDPAAAHWNLGTARLLERALQDKEGLLSVGGALVVRTGQFTGRSPKDKFIVRDATTESTVAWGSVNQPLTPAQFDGIFTRLQAFLKDKEVFIEDMLGGADTHYQLPVRLIVQRAWHALPTLT